MFRILIGILMVFVLGCGEPDPEPVPAPVDETQKEEVEPVDLCANPPPHECCASPTPECNRCRAKYEGYIRGCPGVVDKRIRVPVENEMRWAGGSLQTEDADTDPSARLTSHEVNFMLRMRPSLLIIVTIFSPLLNIFPPRRWASINIHPV